MLRRLLSAIILIGACSGGARQQQPPASTAHRHRFSHREAPALTGASTEATTFPWAAADHENYANRVLLIRDPAILGAKGSWEIRNLLQAAMQAGQSKLIPHNIGEQAFCGSSDIKDLIKFFGQQNTKISAWVTSIGQRNSGCLSNPPIRLLAIVNRADFGRAYGTAGRVMIQKAELRFVFGTYSDSNQPLNILGILEFVLNDMNPHDFQGYVQKWDHLANLGNSPDYAATLDAIVGASLANSENARMRLEIAIPGSNSWKFAQFSFQPDKLVQETLDREIQVTGRYNSNFSGTADCLKEFVAANDQNILSGDYELTDNLATQTADMALGTKALALDNSVLSDPKALRQSRFILSINTCTGCHSDETQANFNHIGNTSGGLAPLSAFLTGSSDGHPSLGAVSVQPALQTLASASSPPETHHYNDLLRRHLYLDQVLQTDPSVSNADAWNSQLADFMIQEIH